MTAIDLRQSARLAVRKTLIAGLQRLTGRTAVLLPAEAGIVELLDARAPYRVSGSEVHYEICAPAAGTLQIRIVGHVSQGAAPVITQVEPIAVTGNTHICLSLDDGHLRQGDVVIGRTDAKKLAARFTTEFILKSGARIWTRRLGHYVVRPAHDQAYFNGGHYRDYEAQAESDVTRTVATLREWGAKSPVLEVGCATGLLLDAFRRSGFDAVGVDASPWAVAQARARVRPQDVVLSDVEDAWPSEIASRRFRTVVMNAVLEHVDDPGNLLARLAAITEPDGLLVLTTANANSLTRWLFGADWEGLSDPTHKSADTITPERLRSWLIASGWQVERLTTHSVWDDNPDPVHATLRDVAAFDARFRQLLVQYQRGDFLDCVARRKAP